MAEANPTAGELVYKAANAEIPKADLKEYGYILRTNEKNEMVYVRPLSILKASEVDAANLTEFDILEILEVKAISVLNRVIDQRQKLSEKINKDFAKIAGAPIISQ